MTTQNYAVDDGHGTQITTGVTREVAMRVAQEHADRGGFATEVYPVPVRMDESDEPIDESVTVQPRRYGVLHRMADTITACTSRAAAEAAQEREPRTLRLVVEGDDGIAVWPDYAGPDAHEPGAPVWPSSGRSTGALRFPVRS